VTNVYSCGRQLVAEERAATAGEDGRPVAHGRAASGQAAWAKLGFVSGDLWMLLHRSYRDRGTDLLSSWLSDGELTSATAQVTISIVRPSLASSLGASGVFRLPELADGDLHTSVNAAYDSASPREVSPGAVWKTLQFRAGCLKREFSLDALIGRV
jgi:hypothetical protein